MTEVIYFSEWSQGIACNGPPSSMSVINALDNGPTSFQWAQGQTVPDTCGYSTLSVPSGCCMGSYDLASSVSASMMISTPVEPSQEQFVKWTPSTAIGSKYCIATYVTEGGFSQTKYLLDDGICRESWQCDQGVLKVSNATDVCMGDYQEVIKDGTFSELLNSTVSLASTEIKEGEQEKVWLGFYPFSLNIIYLTTPGIVFSCIIIALGFLTSVAGCAYILRQMQLHPQRQKIYFPNLLCQLVALAGSIFIFKYYFFTQSGELEFNLLNQFSSLLQALTSYLVIFLNIKSLLYIFQNTEYTAFIKGKEYLLYGALLFVHILLAWPWYLGYLMYTYPILNTWYGFGTIWFGLSLLGNVLSLVGLIYYQLTKSSKDFKPSVSEMIRQLIFNNTDAFVLFMVLVFNLVWFLVCYCLLNLGFYLQNDNDYQVFQVFIWLPVPIDGFIYVWLFDKGFYLVNRSWSYQEWPVNPKFQQIESLKIRAIVNESAY